MGVKSFLLSELENKQLPGQVCSKNIKSNFMLVNFRTHLFIDALWSPAGKGLTSWLYFVMSYCEVFTFPIGILGQVWCSIVSIPTPCPLSYFGTEGCFT